MNGVGGGHDEGLEVFGMENDNVIIIPLPLVMVVVLGQEVGLLVENAGLVS